MGVPGAFANGERTIPIGRTDIRFRPRLLVIALPLGLIHGMAAMIAAGGFWCHRPELSRLECCQGLRDCRMLSAEHSNAREL